MKLWCIYILASLRRILYIGITANLEKRLAYHRSLDHANAFTARYGVTRLVYFEEFTDPTETISCEKQVKGWRRTKKLRLIERVNPDWIDLAPPTHTGPSSSLRSASG